MIPTVSADPLHRVLQALGDRARKSGAGWIAKCPAHEDRQASLSINTGDDGRVLLKCHAGCTAKAICDQLGIELRELFPPCERHHNSNGSGRKIVATYDYLAVEGDLLYQAIRYSPKGFSQRRPDGKGGWINNMDGVNRVPYRLVELRQAGADEWVFICEGEKDCDRLAASNLIATCNVGGAGKWKPEYAEFLRGLRVCIIADKDEAGRNHARAIAATLPDIASEIKIIECPGNAVKDVSDYFDAGGTPESLKALADATPDDKPTQPSSVRELMQKYPQMRPPVIHGLLRRGETMNIIAPSKTGKSWLAIDLAIAEATGRMWLGKFQTEPANVLILDNELHGETCAVRIPKVANARGVLVDEFADKVFVETFRGKLRDVYHLGGYFSTIKPGQFGLVVLDAFYRFLPADADENSNAGMAAIYSYLDSIADRIGCCFVLIHHSSKGSQAEKSVTDVGSGAGAQSRATDTHLILRQHEVDGVIVLDAAVRSWTPIDPLCLQWEYPVWTPAPELDPADLKRPGKSRKRKEDVDAAEPSSPEWTVETFAARFITGDPKTRNRITTEAEAEKISERKTGRLIDVAEERGLIHRWTPRNPSSPIRYATIAQPLNAPEGVIQ